MGEFNGKSSDDFGLAETIAKSDETKKLKPKRTEDERIELILDVFEGLEDDFKIAEFLAGYVIEKPEHDSFDPSFGLRVVSEVFKKHPEAVDSVERVLANKAGTVDEMKNGMKFMEANIEAHLAAFEKLLTLAKGL